MDAPGNMYYVQMLLLLLLMGTCTFWAGRMLQWVLLRRDFTTKKIFLILINSLWVSYAIALTVWFSWKPVHPMWGILCLPVFIAEVIVLSFTIIAVKRKRNR